MQDIDLPFANDLN